VSVHARVTAASLAASAATAATDVAVVLVVDDDQFWLGLDGVLMAVVVLLLLLLLLLLWLVVVLLVGVVVMMVVAGRVLLQIVVVVVHAAGRHDLLLGHLDAAVLLLYQVLDVERQVVRGHRVRDGGHAVLLVRQRLGRGHGVPAGQLELGVHREVVMVMVVRTGQRLLLLLQKHETYRRFIFYYTRIEN